MKNSFKELALVKFIDKLGDDQYVFNNPTVRKYLTDKIRDEHATVLVVRNIELISEIKASGRDMATVYFSTNCKYMKMAAIHYGIPENQVFELEYNNMVISFGTDMKFDIIIANPPYKADLHLRFLNKAIDLKSETGEIVFIHPAAWLVQKRNSSRTKLPTQTKERIAGANIEFIENPWEKVSLWVPLAITHINNSGDYYFTDNRLFNITPKQKINSLDSISILGDISKYLNVFNKLQKESALDNFKKHEDRVGRSYYLTLWPFSGHSNDFERGGTIKPFDNLYDLSSRKLYARTAITSPIRELVITESPQIAKPQGGKLVGNEKPWISFNSLDEAQNCHSFLTKSALIRSYLAVLKINQKAANILLPVIPWLDWTQEWTDEKLFEYFELTQEEISEVYRIIEIITVK